MDLTGASAVEIAASVERAIRVGRVREGERLPSVREAAERLRVNRNTVAAAYARLRDAGLIVGGQGRGGMRVGPTAPFEGRPLSLPPGVCDLASGNVDAQFLPRLERVLDKIDLAPSGYDADADDPHLVSLARERLGAEGLGGELCFCSGALDAIERGLRGHVRAGATVLVEDPGFPPLFDLLRSLGVKLKALPLDEAGVRPEALARGLAAGAAAVVLTPRAQNPFGVDITPQRALELSAIVQRHPQALFVLDDHWGPLADRALSLSPPVEGHWLYVRSVSKFLGPDYRVAIVLGDAATVGRIRRQQALGPRWVSRLLQRMAAALWADPGTEALLAAARAAYGARRDALRTELARAGVTAHGASGVHLWVPVPREAEVVSAMLSRGWAVQAGEPFRLESPPAIRIGVANLTPDSAVAAAQDLVRSLSAPPRFGS